VRVALMMEVKKKAYEYGRKSVWSSAAEKEY